MYDILLPIHSYLRYVVFALIIISLISSFRGLISALPYSGFNIKINKWTVLSIHIQLVLGLILYFVSPNVKFVEGLMKHKELRYWTVEHLITMLIVVALITIGSVKSKKAKEDRKKHKTIVLFWSISFLLIVATILQSGRGLL